MTVLIVEDEILLASEIIDFLQKEGFFCDVVTSLSKASEKLFVNAYDFVLLDLGLPDGDGLQLIKEAKEQHNNAAFIILTARGSTEDKITGLNLGADDYLAKPFSLPELLSRMTAINRRKHGIIKNEINIHGFLIDIYNRLVSYEGNRINLTKKEFEILNYLILSKNRVITRSQLTEHVWGDLMETDSESNFVDVHVKNLRKKLSAFSETDWFETVRGIGYRINV